MQGAHVNSASLAARSRSTLLALNGLSSLCLLILLGQSVAVSTGLWLEVTDFDNHYCHCLQRYYTFPGYVGGMGVYMAIAAYVSARLLSIGNHVRGCKRWYPLVAFVPVAIYFVILYVHRFIEQPYFMG